MKTLVVGATGLLGSEICKRMRAKNQAVRALVRSGSARKEELRALGVEIVEGDLRFRSSVEAACDGVDAVITTATAMGSKDKGLKLRDIDHDAQLQLVDVAKSAGVHRYVYISVSPVLRETAPLVKYKRAVERAIRKSGMTWTILQPSVFMEVWASPAIGWDFTEGKALIFGAGKAALSWISVSDVAEFAVASLYDARVMNRDVPLGGPDRVSPNDVVRIFEELAGRRYRVRRIPKALLNLMAPLAAMVNEAAASGMGLGAQAADGDVFDTTLQKQVSVPLKTVREYARAVVKTK